MAKTNFKTNGRRLAASMLREFSQVNTDAASIENRFHPGKPQRDIFARYHRYLRVVSTKNRRYFEAGFYAVLNDFLAHAMGGAGVMEPSFYDGLNDPEVAHDFPSDEKQTTGLTKRHLTLVYSRD